MSIKLMLKTHFLTVDKNLEKKIYKRSHKKYILSSWQAQQTLIGDTKKM
jgi:hypothetical protein